MLGWNNKMKYVHNVCVMMVVVAVVDLFNTKRLCVCVVAFVWFVRISVASHNIDVFSFAVFLLLLNGEKNNAAAAGGL